MKTKMGNIAVVLKRCFRHPKGNTIQIVAMKANSDKRFFVKPGMLLLLLALLCRTGPAASAQHRLTAADSVMIQGQVMKRKTIGNMIAFNQIRRKDRPGSCVLEIAKYFGATFFSPYPPRFTIVPVTGLDYPDKELALYEVGWLQAPATDSVLAWDSANIGFYYMKKVLVALDKKGEMKCISGCGIDNSILQDFRCSRWRPRSYENFIRFKYFSFGIRSVKYLRRQDGKFVYLIERQGGQLLHLLLDPYAPEKFAEISIVKDGVSQHPDTSPPYPKLVLGSYGDKRRFVLNALMKNLYLYKIRKEEDLYGRLKLDTSSYNLAANTPLLDSLPPGYDEQLQSMEIIRMDGPGYAENGCVAKYPPLWSEDRAYVVGTNLMGVELYRIWCDTVLELGRQGRQADGGPASSGRLDYCYLPDYRDRASRHLSAHGRPIKEAAAPNIGAGYNGNPPCYPYRMVQDNKELEGRIDYYLVGLEPKSKSIYFISGRDIYLSHATELYPGTFNVLPSGSRKKLEDYADWDISFKLDYIRDRLYQYQIPNIEQHNIWQQDREKLVLVVRGYERGERIWLKVTFRNDSPEELVVEKLQLTEAED